MLMEKKGGKVMPWDALPWIDDEGRKPNKTTYKAKLPKYT
jgi:hypothetical protein